MDNLVKQPAKTLVLLPSIYLQDEYYEPVLMYMNVIKMITVPQWKYSKEYGWIVDKSSLLNFLELNLKIEGLTFWTEAEFRNLFPKNSNPDGEISKVWVMWEILDHQKKLNQSAA